jgi:tripartite-type tricarboxylate transporter receptor subunit TctC
MGLRMTHVPYRGAPQGVLAAQTGEVDLAFFNISTLLAGIRSGDLRALAVTSAERSPFLPEAPTMREEGVAGYEMSTWIGLSAVAGTPEPVLRRMHEATRDTMAEPATRERAARMGFDLVPQDPPEAMVALHRAEFERWGPVLRAAGARLD